MTPSIDEYVPGLQLMQTPPYKYVPATHTQPLTVLVPAFEVTPVGHVVHTLAGLAPTVLEYLPVAQLMHTLPRNRIKAVLDNLCIRYLVNT